MVIQSHRHVVLLLFLAFPLMAGCGGGPATGQSSAGEPAKTEVSTSPVTVRTVSVVQEETQPTTTQPATVHADLSARIQSRVAGYISEVLVDIGDPVEQGAILAKVAVPDLERQHDRLAAELAYEKANAQRLAAGIEIAGAEVQSKVADLAAAKAELGRSEAAIAALDAEFIRTRDLIGRQSLESRMLDEVRQRRDAELAGRDAANAAIQASEAAVKVAEARLVAAKADLTAAEAQVQVAETQIEELNVQISFADLRAPFAGIVTERSIDPGDLVKESMSGGAGALLEISRVSQVRIRVPLPEHPAAQVRPGDAVSITFPSFPEEPPIDARVARTSGKLDPSTRTMMIEADVPNPAGKLMPGMFGQATVKLGDRAVAQFLPARAVRFDAKGNAFVYRLDAGNSVEVVSVQVGTDTGASIQVTAGLTVGDVVVDAHLKRLANGQKVAVVQE
ncbi:MAG: efflux RND transporter periplasmic adaptor subunit [Planctomycetaceae bacterium]|nr:efflux RND transporter periplasmic adaptor subunit [Planctomycetaceae bacterium]